MDNTEKKCPCRFRLPLQYNDGTEVEPEKLVAIFQDLDRQFSGHTNHGVSQGSWEGQVEPMLTIEVAVSPNRLEEFRQVVYSIGKSLGQHAMYLDAPPPTVEIIPIDGIPKPRVNEVNNVN